MVAENVVKSPDFICASPNSLKENKKMTEREQFGKWWLKCPVASMAQVPAQTVWDACQRAQLAAPVAAQDVARMSKESQIKDDILVGQARRIAELEEALRDAIRYMPLASAAQNEKRAILAAAPVAAQEPAECDWWQEDGENMPGTYQTACGRMWSFTEGDLSENQMHYCMGCGKKVKDVTPELEPDE